MSQKTWETAMGVRGYRGSPAEKEDRESGIKVGGICHWRIEDPSKPGKMPAATIVSIDIDPDGAPWFTLSFVGKDSGHKHVCVEREEIMPYKGHLQWGPK